MINKLQIDDLIIDNLKNKKYSFKNKNNKFSANGYIGNKKVKVFETFDKDQGKLMKFLSTNKELANYFPKIIVFNNKFIVEEWVDGKTLKELNKNLTTEIPQSDEVKHIINLMWSVEYKEKVFDYIKYIYEKIKKKYNLNLDYLPIRVNHNDLSLDNIVETSTGLKIIDNEFLGCNNGWILNIKNSFIKEDTNYHNYISKKTLDKLWEIRKEWSKVNSEKQKWTLKNFIKKIL